LYFATVFYNSHVFYVFEVPVHFRAIEMRANAQGIR